MSTCICLFSPFSRQTVLVRLDTNGQDALKYQPGDHLAIFPANQPSLVDTLIEQLREAPPPDETIRLEICKEISGNIDNTDIFLVMIIVRNFLI